MDADTPVKTKRQRKKPVPTPDALRIKHLEDMLNTNRVEAEGWRDVAKKQKAKIEALEAENAELRASLNGVAVSIEAIRL